MVLVKIIPHRGGFLLGSTHCFSINYTFAHVGGKVWVGTIIVFVACKNMFTCLSCCSKFSARTKTCFYAFLCHCKVSSPAVGVFEPLTSKFVFIRLARMVCSEDTRVYTDSGGMSLRPVCCCSCYLHFVCSRGYKQAREGKDPKSLVEGVNGC